jgi:hypothetical protein
MSRVGAERPVECRTQFFHAEFFVHAGVIRFRGLKPNLTGTHLVPGSIKFTLDLKRLGPYREFLELLGQMLERHRPR